MHINMSSAKIIETFSSNEVFEVGFKEPYVEYKYNEGIKFPICHFPVILRRHPRYYVLNILGPVGLLWMMSFVPFALPVDSGERVSLLITAFLALSVYQLILIDHVPISSLHLPVFSK